MNRLRAVGHAERTVRNSRFIGVCGPAGDLRQAREFVGDRGAEGCRHVCWAFRAGEEVRFEDAGEPGGTAGRPILSAIEHHELDGAVVVVSRFFGGVKLGTGGLARAYRGTALDAIADAGVEPVVARVDLACRLPFEAAGELHRLIEAHAGEKRAERWTAAGLEATVRIECARRCAFERELTESTRGRAVTGPLDQPPED